MLSKTTLKHLERNLNFSIILWSGEVPAAMTFSDFKSITLAVVSSAEVDSISPLEFHRMQVSAPRNY